jgi:hypothetical protein
MFLTNIYLKEIISTIKTLKIKIAQNSFILIKCLKIVRFILVKNLFLIF